MFSLITSWCAGSTALAAVTLGLVCAIEARTMLQTSAWTLENIQSLVPYLVLFYDSFMTLYLDFVYGTYFLLV